MSSSNLVIAGNPYLAEYATQSGARWIEIVPTVVDMKAYRARTIDTNKNRLCVGWIGTPDTWHSFGQRAYDTLRPVLDKQGATFSAVGASTEPNEQGTLEILSWTESSEVGLIQEMDIGVMPLTETPWARGKCGYKLIQYMACGLPVVASPVGVNSDIVEHGVNGFLAKTDDEWREAVAILLQDAELRHRMGAAGRKKVEKEYSLQIWGPRMTKILRQAIENHNVGK